MMRMREIEGKCVREKGIQRERERERKIESERERERKSEKKFKFRLVQGFGLKF